VTTCFETARKIRNREISAVDVVGKTLERINLLEPKIGAYLQVTEKEALTKAREIDRKLAKGESVGPLAGVPIAVKDNIVTKGVQTTAASKILEGFIPPYDATVVKRLRSADTVIVGKTNLDEFAMGSSTENSGYKVTRNPWDIDRVPGGSSGGSAAAVAAEMCCAALGSDTGGSIRQPASLCGVVGLKPTYGLVSRYGLIAFASSLDQIGPITKDVRDAAIILNVISGRCENDSTSLDVAAQDFAAHVEEKIDGIRLGLPKEYFALSADLEVTEAVQAAAKLYEKLGAKIKEVSLPHTDAAIATYYIIANAEASSNLARYTGIHYSNRQMHMTKGEDSLFAQDIIDGTRTLFGREVKRRIMLGTFVLSSGYYDAYYIKALKVQSLIYRDFEEVFKEVDALITPTSPTPAFRIGENIKDPLTMYLCDVMTVGTNLAGIPTISIPCGFSSRGLPIGMQIIGNRLSDDRILQIARAYERETEFHKKKPRIDTDKASPAL
jgi:aspartyl-tRNA(Asn)/glutamyl-tRNA(Gln) amidotransferase subunit A